jgi:twitching motility protein PilT
MIKAEIIFNRLISSAFEKKASEIILFPSEKPFLRKDGKIEPLVNEEIITTSFINEILDFLLNQEQKERFDKEKQIIFSKDLTDEQRAKIIVLKQKNLLSLSIKLISNKITPLENLKLPNVVKDLASLNSGLLIISGPRDSGRSSLLASIIDYRNRNFVEYISTLENPIEFLFKGNKCLIEQRELNKDVLSFKDGIHLIKNRNVDVFAISEIENLEMIFDLFEICQKGVFVIVILGINSVFNVVK